MKKYLLAFSFALAVSSAFGQGVVKGYVYEDQNGNGRKDAGEKGIAGIAVSNGSDIVLTDAEGGYVLNIGDDDIIFVLKPAGYKTPLNAKNVPQFYYIHKPAGSAKLKFGGIAPTGQLPKSVDFALEKYDEPENFRFFAFGDPQIPAGGNAKAVQYFRKGIVEEANKIPGMSFGLTLGDMMDNNLSVCPMYLDAIAAMKLPWYSVIGNHDRDHDATSDAETDDTYEANFGPSTYAFQYGRANFIVLNNIIPLDLPGMLYTGGLRENQFKFIENYLKLVPKENILFIAFHIPLAYEPNQFRAEDRKRLFELLKDHTNAMILSSHTHAQMILYYGKEQGWDGPAPFMEYNVGATCGNWWSGRIGSDGMPYSLMADGTPQGYALFDVKGTRFTFDYQVAGKPADYVMEITAPKVVPGGKTRAGTIYVNFFMGSPRDKVEYRIDDGEWKPMKFSNALDPAMLNEIHQWDYTDVLIPGSRPRRESDVSLHLWQADLDGRLNRGTHTIEVRATDLFGRVHSSQHTYRIEKQLP